jgi:uncharacterized protein YfaS (alpha-2-macroglobulin family)
VDKQGPYYAAAEVGVPMPEETRTMLNRFLNFVPVALAALAVSCTSTPTAPTVRVVSYGPEVLAAGDAPVQITFSGPLVPSSVVGAPLKTSPAALVSPGAAASDVPVVARWIDRQTLVLRPIKPLARGTRYGVRFLGALASLQSSPATSGEGPSFVFEPLKLVAVRDAHEDWLGTEESIRLVFNLPVKAEDVAKKCALAGPSRVALRAAPAPEGAPALEPEHALVAPATALRRGETYSLECTGLTAVGGNEPVRFVNAPTFRVRPEFAVSLPSLAGDARLPPDRAQFSIRATQPLDCRELGHRVSFAPEVPADGVHWSRRWNTANGEIYCDGTVEFQADTKYRVTLDAGVESHYGERTTAAITADFVTGPPVPRVFLETGTYAIEGQSKGYQLWTRNVRSVDVACAAVPKARANAFLNGKVPLWPERGEQGNIEAFDWKAVGLSPKRATVNTGKHLSKWSEHRLDFRTLCGKAERGGFYFVELRAPDAEAHLGQYERYPYRVLANPTDLGVVAKVGSSGGAVWVTSFASGQPVSGATVTLREPGGKVQFTGVTDASGLVRTNGSGAMLEAANAKRRRAARENAGEGLEGEEEGEYYGDWGAQRLIATVESGGDLAVVDGEWRDGLYAWNFGHDRTLGTAKTQLRGFIQSDRGLYRPGEKVHFQGWVREIAEGAQPSVPAGKKVRITIEDARGQRIHNETKALSPFGGFGVDHELGEGAPLGDYIVRAEVSGHTFTERFSVEEFRPIAFDLALTADKPRRAKGKVTVPFAVSAQYLFGAPVKDAPLTWSASKSGIYFRPPGLEAFTTSDWASGGSTYEWYGDGEYDGGSYGFLSDGEGRTGERGEFVFAPAAEVKELKGTTQFRAEVSVTEPSGQVVTRRVAATVHPADFYLGVKTESWVGRVGEAAPVELRAVTPEGKPVATSAELTVGVRKWECGVFSAGERRTCRTKNTVESKRTVQFDATGRLLTTVNFAGTGEHFIGVTAKDRGGRAVAASEYVWVIGKGQSSWADSEEIKMDMVASQTEYKPGDTATIVPRANVANQYALVTVERSGVIEARVEKLSGETGVRVAVGDALAPNAYVSVVSVAGRGGAGDAGRPRLRMGVVALKVSTESRRLKVVVKTDRARYEPGDPVRGEVLVTLGGKPVSAEVAVSVADEGVLRLIDYQTPDPMSWFYRAWGLGVETSTNYTQLARDGEPRGYVDDGGSDAAGRTDKLRSKFVSSAFWAPALITDAAGRATFNFSAPDNLTAFRAMAVAATTTGSFGSSDLSFEVQKPLMAMPILPRFFEEGDEIEIGATIHNHTEEPADVRVNLTVEGLSVKQREARVRVPKGGSARAMFKATVPVGVVRAHVKLAATSSTHSDGFDVELPVNAPIVTEGKLLASFEGRGDLGTTTVAAPEGVITEGGVLEITVDRSGLAAIAPSLRYLVQYPYGCLEQTLSRTVPLLKVEELGEALDLKEIKASKAKAFARAGVRKILRFQRDDGHFALWPDGESEPHLTAYALWGLSEAQLAGIDVPKDTMKRGFEALGAWANEKERSLAVGGEAATLAMAAYVLAENGRADRALESRLFAARGALPVYGAAFLLRALVASKAPADTIATVVRELESRVTEVNGVALAHEAVDLRQYMGSDVRSTAIVLGALLRADSSHALLPKLKAGLLFSRQWDGSWANTQENSYSLIAFADLARSRMREGAGRVEILAEGKALWSSDPRGMKVLKKTLPLGAHLGKTVRVSSAGDAGVLLRVVYRRRVSRAEAHKFTVSRTYLDPATNKPVGPLRVGDLVKVRLEVHTERPEVYVALRDPIPAGFEALNAKLRTSAQVAGQVASANDQSWWDWDAGWVHRELRDDESLAFANRAEGTLMYEYVLRASHAGKFSAPPAQIEAMYEPERFARTDTAVLEVSP